MPTRCRTRRGALRVTSDRVGHLQLEGLVEGQDHGLVDVLHLSLHLLPVLRAVAKLHCGACEARGIVLSRRRAEKRRRPHVTGKSRDVARARVSRHLRLTHALLVPVSPGGTVPGRLDVMVPGEPYRRDGSRGVALAGCLVGVRLYNARLAWMCGFFVTPACAVCDSPEKNVVIWRDWTTSSFPPAKEGTGETLFSIVDTPRDAGSQRTIENSPADRPRRPLEASSADRASVRRVSTFTSPLCSGHASRGRVPLA